MPKLIDRLVAKLKRQPPGTASSASNVPSDMYSYQPLSDPRNIRLLSLNEGEGQVHISLTEGALDSSPYTALSYTWGSPVEHPDGQPNSEIHRFIYCDNKRHQVTENLFQALSQFRAFGWKGPFWIDAVCIDQGNLRERNTQVMMMGDIYAKSKSVIVWLGESDSETEEAILLITLLGDIVEKLQPDMFTMQKLVFNDPEFYDQAGLEPFSQTQWELIVRFLSRRWFRRLWVLQEIVLGDPTKVIIGPFSLAFEALQLAVLFLTMSGWGSALVQMTFYPTFEDTQGQVKEAEDFGMLLIHTAVALRACKDEGPEYWANKRHLELHYGARDPYERCCAYLAYVINRSRAFGCQDPRDRVFAPLSLVSRFVPSQKLALDWIIPDYSQSIASVVTTLSIILFRQLPIMTLLSHVEDHQNRRLSGLPSWVPDFSCSKLVSPLIYCCRYDIYEGLDFLDDRAKRFQSPTHLRASSLLGSPVKKASRPLLEILLHNKFDSLLDIVSMLPKLGPNKQGRLEVFWRTLIGDHFTAGDDVDRNFPAPIEMAEAFYNYFCSEMAKDLVYARTDSIEDEVFWQDHAIYESFAREEKLPDRCEISEEADRLDLVLKNSEVASGRLILTEVAQTVWDFRTAMQRVIGGRSLIITESGDLGLGPTSTQSGDIVAFIRNTRVPFIVRPAQNECYSIVGEAYIHGFMHGEILKDSPLKFQEIIVE